RHTRSKRDWSSDVCSSDLFIVRTDASGFGMGAVLLQEVDGHRRIIEYASKQFTETQKRYPTIEQEATAILWALIKWQHFLLGGEIGRASCRARAWGGVGGE